jgi:HD-GYP domain-containing protein (c-di-GMP phosphodiesterase class II)
VTDALIEIESNSGSQFDPECVEAFLQLQPQLSQLFYAGAGAERVAETVGA